MGHADQVLREWMYRYYGVSSDEELKRAIDRLAHEQNPVFAFGRRDAVHVDHDPGDEQS